MSASLQLAGAELSTAQPQRVLSLCLKMTAELKLTDTLFSGLGLIRKFQQYRRLPQEPPAAPTHHLEEELDRLTGKIVRILRHLQFLKIDAFSRIILCAD